MTTPEDAAEGADVIVVAVKPTDVDAVLAALSKVDLDGEREQIIVSLAAGISTARYESKLPAGFPVVRVMPNTPMLVGQGASAIAPDDTSSPSTSTWSAGSSRRWAPSPPSRSRRSTP